MPRSSRPTDISNPKKQEKFLGLDEFSPKGVKPEGVLRYVEWLNSFKTQSILIHKFACKFIPYFNNVHYKKMCLPFGKHIIFLSIPCFAWSGEF